MIITNRLGLPTPFVDMAQKDYIYEPNEYRVTSLLKGIRETLLERRYSDQIEQDASDMIWLLFGTAVHRVLESHQEADTEIKEERIKIQFGKYILSGQFDLYNDETKTITDYKTCSVWKIIFGDYEDWRRQTLIYCYMLRQIGFDAANAEIVALMKDHSKRDAKIKANYPQLPVQKISFTFTEDDFKECEAWLTGRFADIAEAEDVPDCMLPMCTPKERFNSGDKFAVMKKGRKTALRVMDSPEEAKDWMAMNGGDEIVIRKGEDKKCVDYCSVCNFCDYYQEVYVKKEKEEIENAG